MLMPVSGFGKGDPGLELDVERMANGNMADGKCVPASKDGSRQKRQKRQAHSKSFAGSSAAFVIRQSC